MTSFRLPAPAFLHALREAQGSGVGNPARGAAEAQRLEGDRLQTCADARANNGHTRLELELTPAKRKAPVSREAAVGSPRSAFSTPGTPSMENIEGRGSVS